MALKTEEIVDHRLVKALAHPLRVQILTTLNERVASPNELAKEFGEGLSQVSYHVKVLRDYECIELVETKQRRGAIEHFYRGMRRAYFSADAWKQLPTNVQGGISASVLRRIFNDAARAVNEGTFDAREDRHLSWTPVIVDGQGWEDLTALLAKTLDRVMDIQAESAGRLVEARAEGVSARVAILNFESPTPEEIAPDEVLATAKR